MNFSFFYAGYFTPRVRDMNIIVHLRKNYNYKTATISLLFRVNLHFSAKHASTIQFILHIKAENDNIAVTHDIFFAFGTDKALLLCGCHCAAGHQVVI